MNTRVVERDERCMSEQEKTEWPKKKPVEQEGERGDKSNKTDEGEVEEEEEVVNGIRLLLYDRWKQKWKS